LQPAIGEAGKEGKASGSFLKKQPKSLGDVPLPAPHPLGKRAELA
jgi:hypothetical protein